MEKKKNIIFILSDQHNPFIMGNAGDTIARTPNLDRAAREGIRVSNCYCSSPLCVPSRSSMLSAKLPSRTGIFNNLQSLRYEDLTFVHSLAIAGYRTVLSGRMHFKGCDQRHGFEERLIGSISSPLISYEIEGLGKLEPSLHQNKRGIENSGPGHSAIMDYDTMVTDAACSLLKKHRSEDERPLFLTVGFFGPHCPFVCTKELFDYYYQKLPEPEISTEFKKNVHPAVKQWYKNRDIMDTDIEAVKRARAAYYGCVEFVDSLIGRINECVERSLGTENTVIVYGSDHGEMLGDKGLFWKTNMYEGSVKVPLIFRVPNEMKKKKEIRQAVSLMDLGPTFIDIADAPNLPDVDGTSILDILLTTEEQNSQRPIIAQLGDIKGDSPSAMIRKNKWKLVSHFGYNVPQLFNLEEDPQELNDLGGDSALQDIRDNLLLELSQYWKGEEVQELVKSQLSSIDLMRRWEKATKFHCHNDEWWKGDPERNYIN